MFNKIKKRKELIDREIAVYKQEQLLKVDTAIEGYRASKAMQIETLAKQCAEQIGDYEHTFHSTKENLGIELAKLEAKKEALVEIVENDKITYNKMIEQKDVEIKRLNDIIQSMIKAQPVITIQQVKAA